MSILTLLLISGCNSGNEISVSETEIPESTEITESIVSIAESSIVKESSVESKIESKTESSLKEIKSKVESSKEIEIEVSETSEISEIQESSAESTEESQQEFSVEESSYEESVPVSNTELVGFYKLTDTTSDGEHFINMEKYNESGLYITVEIFSDGTGEFTEYDDIFPLTWNDRYIILDGEKAEYRSKGNQLAVYAGDNTLIFEKTDKSTLIKEESEIPELSGETDENVIGRYILTDMTSENRFKNDIYLTLNADGTGIFDNGIEKTPIEWDDGEIEMNGEIFYYETDKNKIILDFYGIYWTFELKNKE